MRKVEVDGRSYLVKGPNLCPPEAGFHEIMGVAWEFEHNGGVRRFAVELRHDDPGMSDEAIVRSVKPLLDRWERDFLSGKHE